MNTSNVETAFKNTNLRDIFKTNETNINTNPTHTNREREIIKVSETNSEMKVSQKRQKNFHSQVENNNRRGTDDSLRRKFQTWQLHQNKTAVYKSYEKVMLQGTIDTNCGGTFWNDTAVKGVWALPSTHLSDSLQFFLFVFICHFKFSHLPL